MRIKKFTEKIIIISLAKYFYFFGLSILLFCVLTKNFKLFNIFISPEFITGTTMIVLAIVILLLDKKSIKKSFRFFGKITLIAGLIGLFLPLVIPFAYRFSELEFFINYSDFLLLNVPRLLTLSLAYVVIGFLLFYFTKQ